MTADEIVRNYNDAKKKQEQIEILADLNACKKSEIAHILLDAGCQVPKPYGPGMQKPEKPAPATDLEAEPDELARTYPACIMEAVNIAIAHLTEELQARRTEIQQKEAMLAELLEEQRKWR